MAPKSFGPVFALYDGSDTTQYAFGDLSGTSIHPPVQTPVDTLLASLAYCMVKSVEWSADQHKAILSPFTVKVTGTKALDLPGRVQQMDITIIGQLVENADLARKILEQAKSICTVSNTLNCEISLGTEPASDV